MKENDSKNVNAKNKGVDTCIITIDGSDESVNYDDCNDFGISGDGYNDEDHDEALWEDEANASNNYNNGGVWRRVIVDDDDDDDDDISKELDGRNGNNYEDSNDNSKLRTPTPVLPDFYDDDGCYGNDKVLDAGVTSRKKKKNKNPVSCLLQDEHGDADIAGLGHNLR